MGKHVSEYASALVTSPKAASLLSHQTFVIAASPAQGKQAAAVELASTQQQPPAEPSQTHPGEEHLSRHTEHAPTADSIRQGILQVGTHATCKSDPLSLLPRCLL